MKQQRIAYAVELNKTQKNVDVNYNNSFLNVWIFLFLCRELERRPTLILEQNAPRVYIGWYFLQWVGSFFSFLFFFFLKQEGRYQT